MATIEHGSITDPKIHEPKGVAAADSGQIYVANGSGSGIWSDPDDLVFTTTTTNTFGNDLHIHAAESTSTSLSSGWATRPATSSYSTITNGITSASVSTNTVSLPAGTYYIEATATAFLSAQSSSPVYHVLRARDTTSNTTLCVGFVDLLASGLNITAGTGGGNEATSIPNNVLPAGGPTTLRGKFTLGSTKTVALQSYLSSSSTKGGFDSSDSGETASTVDVHIWKVG